MAGDFNGDGHTDLAVANSGSNDTTCRCCWATATAPSSPRSLTPVGSDSRRPRDGRLQRRRPHRPRRRQLGYDNDVSVLLGNGDGTFQTQVTYAVGSYPVALVTGDFNGDGRTDLAVANNGGTTPCRCCWATATARSSPRSPTRWGTIPDAIVAGDFNGDGRTDLAVANSYDNDVSMLLGNGDGTFQPRSPTRWGPVPSPS